jgi:hypothetical protein
LWSGWRPRSQAELHMMLPKLVSKRNAHL